MLIANTCFETSCKFGFNPQPGLFVEVDAFGADFRFGSVLKFSQQHGHTCSVLGSRCLEFCGEMSAARWAVVLIDGSVGQITIHVSCVTANAADVN